MKRFFPIILSIMLLALGIFAGCSDSYYNVPENHCIVGINKQFTLYSESESKFCEPIEQKIKGVEYRDSYNYYSVIKGANYTICVDDFVDQRAGFGEGINGSVSAAWWQGTVIYSFIKNYAYYSGKENEEFFKTNYKQLGGNVSVTFTENCTVLTTYEEYINVGGIFAVVKKDSGYFDTGIYDYINEYGNITETDGFYYLLLKDEVCIHQDAWKTNFEITDYKCTALEDSWNGIRAEFTTNAPIVADDEEWVLYRICRTYSGIYFINSPFYAGNPQGFTMPIREHELKLIFNN